MAETSPTILSLLALVRARAALFTDAGGEPFAELCAAAGGDVLRLRSDAFRSWVDREWYERTSDVAPPEARRHVLSLLEVTKDGTSDWSDVVSLLAR